MTDLDFTVDGGEMARVKPGLKDHLRSIITGPRVLGGDTPGNDVPFFLCPYDPEGEAAMQRLIVDLAAEIGATGTRVLTLDLYRIAVDLLQRTGRWDRLLSREARDDNLMELLEVVALRKPDGEDVRFNLLTAPDSEDLERQAGYLEQIRDGIAPLGVEFSWTLDGTSTIHARHLVTDTGWKILLDRGLDVFQRADLNNGFSPANRHQRFRQVKAFEVTYLRDGKDVMGSPHD